MFNATVRDRLAMRKYARGIGDVNLEQACNADLVANGYRDDVPAVPETPVPVMETTEAVIDGLEQAVPESPRRGRKPMPRCEHNNIVGRCARCEEEKSHV